MSMLRLNSYKNRKPERRERLNYRKRRWPDRNKRLFFSKNRKTVKKKCSKLHSLQRLFLKSLRVMT